MTKRCAKSYFSIFQKCTYSGEMNCNFAGERCTLQNPACFLVLFKKKKKDEGYYCVAL